MEAYLERAQRIVARIDELAAISEDQNGITRTFGTKAFIEGRNKVEFWMKEAGLATKIDSIGNVRGKLLCNQADAKTFVIASHIDTVVNAGKWDGPLGVTMGLDLIEQLIKTKTILPFDLELIAFSDEEGVRFHTTYLGSKVVAGSFDVDLLEKKDPSAITLREAIATMDGDICNLEKDAIKSEDCLGYFEIHIEQGPVLYEKNISTAVVTSIAGQQRIEITFKGLAGHAGTVPMNMRNDALCCAAEFIIETEKYALENKENIVATVGKLNIINAASNVIPGEVICSLDVRSADENILNKSSKHLQNLCKKISEERNIRSEWDLIQKTAPVTCDSNLVDLLSQAIAQENIQTIALVSGAGHDAVPISAIAPVAMLFVRCFKGISHNPLEDVELKDIEATVKISDNFIQNLIKKYNQ
ncbi:allantoate amidohydrolase [Segetibacter aerophilus]|uniref:Zn-dependent hydrolase n=1 Tax=Segetibacter aerophilus TaxID=670293 RepID=A0A512B7T8_9BACT|nr:allantoate amidohydrolase [Segetibacter aerophilus]GEO07979.1 Zn-dependent hydrolase [Segetibacter aerophilus]